MRLLKRLKPSKVPSNQPLTILIGMFAYPSRISLVFHNFKVVLISTND